MYIENIFYPVLSHRADIGPICPYTYKCGYIIIIQTVSTYTTVLNIYFTNRSTLGERIHLCIKHMSGRHRANIGKRLPIFRLPADIGPMWACLLGLS